MKITTHLEERAADRAVLEALFSEYEYGRYVEDKTLPLVSSRRLVLDRLEQYLAQPGSKRIVAVSPAGELLGLIAFKVSGWDTDHFGVVTVIIEALVTRPLGYEQELAVADSLVREFLAWCKASHARFLSVKVPSRDLPVVHALEHNGFDFIESWIYNKYDLGRLEGLEKPAQGLRLARPEDRELMIACSHDAFSTHRFHADPHIPLAKADSLYEKWITTAFGDPNQEILVLDSDGKPAAFMIYYRSDLSAYFGLKFAMWKMALLDPNNRGKGLGNLFFTALLFHHRQDGLDVVDSGLTIRNIASVNLHTRMNFKVISTLVTLHKWLEN